MIIRSDSFKNFTFQTILLNSEVFEQVSSFCYLGHIISEDGSDDSDIMRHCRYLYAVGNSLIRRFSSCSLAIKLKLFTVYCGSIYTGHLWVNYEAQVLNKIKVAYNSILRRLLHIPRHVDGVSYSASNMFVTHNVPNLPCLLRLRYSGFASRITSSHNSILIHLGDMNRVSSSWWSHYRRLAFVVY